MLNFLKKLIKISRNKIFSSGKTDTGKVRSHNEDTYVILADRNIFLVADGMGGHNAGEVASQAAIETLDNYFLKETIRKIKGNPEEIRHFLIKGFHHTNKVVMDMAERNDSRNGMGCTLISCLIDGDFLHTCHVGDTRCYISSIHDFEQLTTDHSVIAAFEKEILSGNTVKIKRPPRQAITRAIGFPFPEDPEYHRRQITPGNRLLLCSDGLWSMVNDEQIHQILLDAKTPGQAGDTLVRLANEAGGTDNITALVIFVDPHPKNSLINKFALWR